MEVKKANEKVQEIWRRGGRDNEHFAGLIILQEDDLRGHPQQPEKEAEAWE